MKWWMYGGAAVIILITGFIAGRRSIPRPGTVLAPTSRDGGVPEAVAKATVGGTSSSSEFRCKVEPPPIPPKPKIVYVSVPGVSREVAVTCPDQPSCPVVTCSGSSLDTTGAVSATTAVPVCPTPVAVPVPRCSTLGLGLAGSYASSSLKPGGAFDWQPFSHLGFHAAVAPNGAMADVTIRF